MADNSLIGKHHGLILDLLVQGQDVIIDERALQVKKQTKDAGLEPQLMLTDWPHLSGGGSSSGCPLRWEGAHLTCSGPDKQ